MIASVAEHFKSYSPRTNEPPDGFFQEFAGNIIRKQFWPAVTWGREVFLDGEGWPARNESLFEWIDLAAAIDDARDRFVIVELGAGFGRWIGSAACMIRQSRPDLAYRLLAVEADPTHFSWIAAYLLDNGVDPAAHKLIYGAACGRDGAIDFVSGHPGDWYGQALASTFGAETGFRHDDRPSAKTITVPGLSLETVTRGEGMIDLLHMDVQNAEGEIIETSLDLLQARVRRAHIGTHSPAVEKTVREAFSSLGWTCAADFPANSVSATPYGPIQFGDGVQSWRNPHL
ncbi:MAG: FkbM family methyltransferase [Hyphomonadaceae bacterium]